MIEKLNKVITEKSEKIMANEKVEGFVNNLGGVMCFFGAIVFGIMFIVGGASLMKTGKNYVVKPSAEEATSESTSTEESPATETSKEE
ncbi:MAG: hypothetical protein DWB56_09215 [Candidatus Jettenia sp.]|uniref:Uncharacterized protein n=1 Tax=Candidatus Jettenia caeni TaxID=247490 RepID=I3IRE6_9BACT|nr:hypothetical protein [Candidatus Jettenia sp. AMX1]MBC6929125.1 hypothetical protein [Candidatus Jettenia sp.]NUN23427.1 hypothetical protein [Candidatus Jettenia caeni]KAA0249579.1 MAG: hypothetical protein EDM77_08190 [Candidatus Jettenia sp. AMX1]MCE7880388.1 hypothetical protein [Candidatus Jettenia sp. AMX1]MCQ3927280.1 hypothetical protein [Candidatus Jettenia sp.]